MFCRRFRGRNARIAKAFDASRWPISIRGPLATRLLGRDRTLFIHFTAPPALGLTPAEEIRILRRLVVKLVEFLVLPRRKAGNGPGHASAASDDAKSAVSRAPFAGR